MEIEVKEKVERPNAGDTQLLFRPFQVGPLRLENRIVMAPMTRGMSPGGVPSTTTAAYYRARAKGGTGLIISEGTWIPHSQASNAKDVPCFYGDAALAGWTRVVEEVHAEGGKIVPQLWHVGIQTRSGQGEPDNYTPLGPSGLLRKEVPLGSAMTNRDIDAVIEAFATAAANAYRIGFDGVEVHGAHGYLVDQFFWSETNARDDAFGGSLTRRTRFAAEIVREIRRRTAPDFPIILRISQWKMQDYNARLVDSPAELEAFLAPLVDAGVDIFDCSQRRFWEPLFVGSHLNLAGWTKKLTGRPTITVGSVTLNKDMHASLFEKSAVELTGLGKLYERLAVDEFDLVAVGRAMLSDPNWASKIKRGALDELTPYNNMALKNLI